MKKEMSSFDVRSIVSELSQLEGAHMDKIFQWGEGNVLFRLNVQGDGKRELYFKDKKWLFLSPTKPDTQDKLSSFATFLRKYIDNARIGKTIQAGFDRIVIMEVFKANADYKLIFEMFGGGNVLLVLDGKIVNCLTHKTFRDRSTRPGEDYLMPKTRFDPLTSSKDEFKTSFQSSESDVVRTLATSINLGGQYAEEVCKRSEIDKNILSTEITEEQLDTMYNALHEIVDTVINNNEPTIFMKDGKIEDIAPINLQIYESQESERLPTMSLAISKFIDEAKQEKEETFVSPEITKLIKRISKQEETIEEYRLASEDLKQRADAMYLEYQKVNDLLNVINEQSKKITWDKLTEGAKKIPYVVSINPSKNQITLNLADLEITLDYTLTLDANASEIYQKGKDIGEKSKRAVDAITDSKKELEKKQKGFNKEQALILSRVQPTKQFWFERYKWFITSTGKLVIAGRDARTNDNVVKKHLKDQDVFAHAEVHGAPSVILKEGNGATPEELREVCIFAVTQSKAWIAVLGEGTAFWVYPDQVSKTPNSGEFIPRGAFVVRGKRNYEHHLLMELGVGEITYMDTRKIMCGPVNLFENCDKYYVIKPSRGKLGRKAGEIAKEFNVPEEEISRILPPGDVEIIRKIWKEEISEENSEN